MLKIHKVLVLNGLTGNFENSLASLYYFINMKTILIARDDLEREAQDLLKNICRARECINYTRLKAKWGKL